MENPVEKKSGMIAWMVHNRVTPNIIMLVLMIGGLFMATRIKQEVFPDFDLDIVRIRVAYPGSSPEEVEQGIVLSVEEAIRGLDGIKEVTSVAGEGSGSVTAELLEDADTQKVYQDIKQEIDRIRTFPEDAERPDVTLVAPRREVLQIEIFGQVSEWVLRELAEEVRDRLLQNPQITQIDLQGARDYEVHIEVPQETLRAYGLTLNQIASKIRTTSIEMPGGYIETKGGDILLRVKQRRDWANEFEKIPVVTTAHGTVLYLSDIAKVTDDFEETDRFAKFNGSPSIGVEVFRVGKQTPIGVSQAARKAMLEIEKDLPPRVNWAISRDRSDVYRQRLTLLLKNAFFGLILVLVLLTLFLEYKLAFWVTLGIPISFLGAFLFLPGMDITINMMSMFAFIVALGIVVDDAIVAGENIYEYRTQGKGLINAAIAGAKDVSIPISFSILTNIIAFLPLCFVPGVMGKIFKTIPLVVITVFAISWIESLLILPSHLAHSKTKTTSKLGAFFHDRQQRFSRKFIRFVENVYGPFLDRCINHRYLTVSVALAVAFVIFGFVRSGRISMILMPRIEANRSVVTAILPYGSAFEKVSKVNNQLVNAAQKVVDNNGNKKVSKGIFSRINENEIMISVYMTHPKIRPISTTQFTEKWRKQVGQIVGLESLKFQSDRGGPGSGASLTVELSHRDIDVLDQASSHLAQLLSDFPNVKDIDDGFTPGKEQLDFTLKPEGESLGLTAYDVARQVRYAFHGAEALRQQRGRNEIKVKVRLPKSQRISEYDLEQLLIRTPTGTDVPLMQIAQVERGRAYTTINRRNARRNVTVTADVVPISDTPLVQKTLNDEILPKLLKDYPGLSSGYEGRQADIKESTQRLFSGFILALLGIFVLLAIPFGSYSQPLIVMVAVPFGIIGAVLGHMAMGYSLSIMSMMGIIALSGVVVNDSLILIDYSNRLKKQGIKPFEAIHLAGLRRFRPIILTSLTTFGGLAPMIFETSRQARFMIPMALSLGYGILFSTVVTLILVPSLSMILEDAHTLIDKFKPDLRS